MQEPDSLYNNFIYSLYIDKRVFNLGRIYWYFLSISKKNALFLICYVTTINIQIR